jgi:biotin carboxyl carrier protein
VPERPPDDRRPARESVERAADHAEIERLAAALLPALIAKLGATGLGEIEVREGPWRVRLRRPGGPTPRSDKAGAGSSAGARDRRPADRAASERSGERAADRSQRSLRHALEAVTARTDTRAVATSPAVGTYQPRLELSAGDQVRSGDRLGAVDMLGVPQEVVAPADGVVGASLVEPGDAVEYGQELLVIELGAIASSTNGTS